MLAARPDLLSVMLANNETGVVQDVAALAETARSSGAWFHTDAVQAIGKLPVDYTKGSPRTVVVDREGFVYTVTSNGKVLKYQITGE